MKTREWTDDPEINEILNKPTVLTWEIAQFDRIMQHLAIEAMNRLRNGLTGVMETIQRGAGRVVDKADDFAKTVKDASDVQAAQQGKLVLLTWVIAGATVVYAALNIVTAFEMSQANAIQRDMVAATNKAADAAIAANSIQRDMVAATNKAADAAIAANELQRQALANPRPARS